MLQHAMLSLFLAYLIQHERGIGRVFERIRIDLPRYLADNNHLEAAIELETLISCPFCLSAYTSLIVLLMPVSIRRWLEVWLIAYTVIWIYKENTNERTYRQIRESA